MKTKTKPTFKQLLDKTGRKQYISDDVVAEVGPHEEQKIVIFTIGKYVATADLESEAAKLGYKLAHPYALALYAEAHPEFADERSIATQWRNGEGNLCFTAFKRWSDGREVNVYRRDGCEWDGNWWFAGLRKINSQPSTPESSSVPSDLDLAIETVKKAGYTVSKIF